MRLGAAQQVPADRAIPPALALRLLGTGTHHARPGNTVYLSAKRLARAPVTPERNQAHSGQKPECSMMRPTDMLKVLPDLAAEVFLTWGHPNPAGEQVGGRSNNVHQVPLDLTAWDALRPDTHGQLARLSACVRMVAEELRDEGLTWPDLSNPPTWVAESDWLLTTADWWQRQTWHEDITHEITGVWRELTRAARTPPPLRLVCTRCSFEVRGKAEVAGGSPAYYQCDAGHIIEIGPELKRLGQIQEFTTTELAEHMGITRRTLRRWKAAGAIQPIGRRGQDDLYAIADVHRAKGMLEKVERA